MTLLGKKIELPFFLWSLAIAALLFNTGFYLYGIRQKEKELASLEREYQLKRASRKPAPGARDELNKELKEAYDRLPEWKDFTLVIGEIYKKAERLNLFISSASYQPAAIKDSGLVKVTVSMPVIGVYEGIKRFIYDLETSPRLFIIEDLSLGSDAAEEGEVSLKLTIAVYFKG